VVDPPEQIGLLDCVIDVGEGGGGVVQVNAIENGLVVLYP
jgi:hypothetical protein